MTYELDGIASGRSSEELYKNKRLSAEKSGEKEVILGKKVG